MTDNRQARGGNGSTPPDPARPPSGRAGARAKDDQRESQLVAMGEEIRRLRLLKGVSLRAFAAMTGLSPGFISLVERGKCSVGLDSLGAIAQTLDVAVYRLMETPAAVEQAHRVPHIVRADGEARAVIKTGRMEYRVLSSPWADRVLEPLLVTVSPHMPPMGTPHGHPGEEFGMVIQGEVVFMVDGRDYTLRAGDSIHMKSGLPHEIRNDTGQPAQVMYVSTSRLLL